MATVKIPPVLRSSTGNNKQVTASGETLGEVLTNFFATYPSLRGQILDNEGALSKFINIYVDEQDVRYLQGLQTKTDATATVTLLPAMAGGR